MSLNNSQWKNPTGPQKKAMQCFLCQNKELAFVAEYHKENRLRFWRDFLKNIKKFLIGLTIIILLSTYGLEDFLSNLIEIIFFWPFFVWLILTITINILTTIINTRESHTHVRIICQNCGCTWIID